MQEGKKKGSTFEKRKQIEEVKPSQWAKSNKEVHLDVTQALIFNLNVSKQIIGSKPPHPNAPFSSPLECQA
jgi:hypothetical protein